MRFPRALLSILAGVAVASALFAVAWWQIGIIYAEGRPMPFMSLYGELFLTALAIALVAGFAVGSVRCGGRLAPPGTRGVGAAVIFTILAVPICRWLTIEPSAGAELHSSAEVLSVLGALLLLGALSVPFALPFVVAAAVGARGAEWFTGKSSPEATRLMLGILSVLLLGAVFAHGATLRSARHHFEERLAPFRTDIDRDLVEIPSDCRLHARMSGISHVRFSAPWYELGWGQVNITLGKRGQPESANLQVYEPGGRQLGPRASAVAILRKRGVREPMLEHLKTGRSPGVWEASSGRFTLWTGGPYQFD